MWSRTVCRAQAARPGAGGRARGGEDLRPGVGDGGEGGIGGEACVGGGGQEGFGAAEVHDGERDLTGWPFRRRGAALEELFAGLPTAGPPALCPSTSDPALARKWLGWTAAGLEGRCFKRLDERCLPGRRAWRRYGVRTTTEAVVGAVTGTPAAPDTVLLGRWNRDGQLRCVGRTAALNPVLASDLTWRLTPARAGRPWTGWTFCAGWGSRETVDVRPVEPEAVLEVCADTARDSAGRWRHPVRTHPVRAHRIRTDLGPHDLPPP
ncbi:hypothetical protein [Kitasatospora griseola]|uniref:hypothetical protein n=1 Tax=Kitasatospora griseola TaxID=2064 RepID=UPI0034325E47